MTKIVFFGNERLSSSRADLDCPSFKYLVASPDYEVEALILKSKDINQMSKREAKLLPSVVKVAQSNNIPIICVRTKADLQEAVDKLKSKVAVLAAFGMIIPAAIIDHFKHGIVNIHPSLLPKYRGSTPIESAILNGDDTLAVSLMSLSPGMDDGPVWVTAKIQMPNDEPNKQNYTETLSLIGAKLLADTLPAIINDNLLPTPQSGEPSYTPQLSKQDAWHFSPDKTCQQTLNAIRAYLDWPGSKLMINSIETSVIEVSEHTPEEPTRISKQVYSDGKALVLKCADGYLKVDKLKPAGSKAMTGNDFLNGFI